MSTISPHSANTCWIVDFSMVNDKLLRNTVRSLFTSVSGGACWLPVSPEDDDALLLYPGGAAGISLMVALL